LTCGQLSDLSGASISVSGEIEYPSDAMALSWRG